MSQNNENLINILTNEKDFSFENSYKLKNGEPYSNTVIRNENFSMEKEYQKLKEENSELFEENKALALEIGKLTEINQNLKEEIFNLKDGKIVNNF